VQMAIAAAVGEQATVLLEVTGQLAHATAAADKVLAGLDRLAAGS